MPLVYIIVPLIVTALVVFSLSGKIDSPRRGLTDTSSPGRTFSQLNSPVTRTPTPSPTPTPVPVPSSALITNTYHIYQTFNNCGPAALSMALSYYGIQKSQAELGAQMRPYQNPQGDNDDKSVTLEEVAEKAREFGLLAYHRPNGTNDLVKRFISAGFPVITRTRLKAEEDIGHFRIIKGYDDSTGVFIQDDSLQGKDLRYTYDAFSDLWKTFNFEYTVLVPVQKELMAREILGPDWDERQSWVRAKEASIRFLQENPDDMFAQFNLSVALYHTGEFARSVTQFEAVQSRLPMRTLWYQLEPILSYYELGNYDKVFEITDAVLTNNNRAYSELYILRGNIFKSRGRTDLALSEYEKAVLYNTSSKEARDALASVTANTP